MPRKSYWTEERLEILKEECLKAKSWMDCEQRMKKRGVIAPWSTMQKYASIHKFERPNIQHTFWTEEKFKVLEEECFVSKSWPDCERRMKKRGIIAPWQTLSTYASLHKFKRPKMRRGRRWH